MENKFHTRMKKEVDNKINNDNEVKEIDNTIKNFTEYFETKNTNKNFGAVFLPLKDKIVEKEQIEKEISDINNKVKFYDLIDLLQEDTIKIETISYSLLKNVLEELRNAIIFFEKYNTGDDYLQISKDKNTEIKNIALKRIFDSLHFDSTVLLKDNDLMDLVQFLDSDTQRKVKVRYLKIRKNVLIMKQNIFVKKFEFLIMQAIKQELHLYFEMFGSELEAFIASLEKQALNHLFEMFVFSFLRQILESMEIERIKQILNVYTAEYDSYKVNALQNKSLKDTNVKKKETLDLCYAYKICAKCMQFFLNGKENDEATNEVYEL